MDLLFDIETDDLLDDLATIHSVVIRDAQKDEVVASCTDEGFRRGITDHQPIEYCLQLLSEADRIYGHNIIGFDIPAIKKVYPEWDFQGEAYDTLVLSRARYAHIKDSDFGRHKKGKIPGNLIGSQSLEAWGYRLGLKKDEYTDWCEANEIEDPWSEWRPSMQRYCEQDTAVNMRLLEQLRNGGLPSLTVEIEHDLAWYLQQQERNGWPFDFERGVRLQAELAQRRQELEEELREAFGMWVEPKMKKGEIVEFTPKRNHSGYGYYEGCPMTRIEIKEFNPGSRDHIRNRLKALYDWEPKEFTPTGKGKVSEDVLKGLDYPETNLLVEYLTIDKRLGQVSEGRQAWLKQIEEDRFEGGALTGMPHIHHRCDRSAITHRHIHSNPNLGQVPTNDAPYGEQCRSCFTVPDGWAMLGSDASGLELRCLAHYMASFDDGEYAEAVLEGDKSEGTDPHSLTAKATGLDRPEGKRVNYAYLYGAGDAKLGSIKYPSASEDKQRSEGKKIRRNLEANIRGLGTLSKKVEAKAKKHGFVRLIDGRRAYIRAVYSALNTLLQGTGAIICKAWIVEFNRRLMEEFDTPHGGGWKYPWAALGWIHDEVQLAVRPDVADRVAEIVTDSIETVGEDLGFRLPLEADAEIGQSWRETH